MDYSKWDRLARDIEDDEEYDEEENPEPLVTRFDEAGGKSITIGPGGASIAAAASSTASQTLKATPTPAAGADSSVHTKNGGRTADYAWSQSRDEVVVQMPLAQQRARDLRVSFDSKTKLLRITHAQPSGDTELLSRALHHDIHPAETDDGALATVDWEVRSRPRSPADGSEERILELTLRKKPPFPGVTVWWKAVCVGDPEIDVSKIAGRDAAKVQDTNSLWREAHAQFLDKVRTDERVVVDLEEEEEEGAALGVGEEGSRGEA